MFDSALLVVYKIKRFKNRSSSVYEGVWLYGCVCLCAFQMKTREQHQRVDLAACVCVSVCITQITSSWCVYRFCTEKKKIKQYLRQKIISGFLHCISRQRKEKKNSVINRKKEIERERQIWAE
jgi:hypothetical protein